MKHMKTVVVPERTSTFVDFVTCDLCGEKVIKKGYDVDEVEIRHKVGYIYPDGGSVTEASVDMCGKCFDERLVPWLRSKGAEPHSNEWDW